jgi:ABC-type Zn uptake system ZnuABC Zn-binding protein ZnuA
VDKKLLMGGIGVGVVALALVTWALWQPAAPDPAGEGLTVAATIFPLADIVRHVGGEHVNVIVILPPGVTEHSNALTPQTLQELQGAQALFQIGHNLDTRLTERITAAIPALEVVTVDKGIALREFALEEETEDPPSHEASEGQGHHHDEGVDPHYWLTVPNAQAIAETMADTLIQLDPAHAQDFRNNLASYQAELTTLEAELQGAARAISRKEFIAMHNAWSYFADHYGFRLVATYEPVEGKDPAIADLQHLREVVQQYGITTFFAEPQKATSQITAFMQQEFGLRIGILDPVGGVAGRDSYAELMRFNMNSLAEGSR